MNLADVKNRVKRQFGDESAVQITDDDILRWVNDAQREIVLNNEGVNEVVGTLNLVANQQNYNVPVDMLTLQAVHCLNTVGAASYFKLEGYRLAQFDEVINGWDGNIYGPGQPAIFTIFAGIIRLFPIPSQDVTAGLKYYYTASPTEVVLDADELTVPYVYHNAVVNYCLKQAYELDEDYETSNLKGAEMQREIMMARGQESWKIQESYETITTLPDDQW